MANEKRSAIEKAFLPRRPRTEDEVLKAAKRLFGDTVAELVMCDENARTIVESAELAVALHEKRTRNVLAEEAAKASKLRQLGMRMRERQIRIAHCLTGDRRREFWREVRDVEREFDKAIGYEPVQDKTPFVRGRGGGETCWRYPNPDRPGGNPDGLTVVRRWRP